MKHVEPWTFIKITQAEYNGLLRVRDGLASGRMKHVSVEIPLLGWVKPVLPPNGFNMEYWQEDGMICGTCACIGGWMGIDYLGDYSAALEPLFYPDLPRSLWAAITTSQAVKAIDNFIAIGEPNWLEATR